MKSGYGRRQSCWPKRGDEYGRAKLKEPGTEKEKNKNGAAVRTGTAAPANIKKMLIYLPYQICPQTSQMTHRLLSCPAGHQPLLSLCPPF